MVLTRYEGKRDGLFVPIFKNVIYDGFEVGVGAERAKVLQWL
jgi:hypothetical protein